MLLIERYRGAVRWNSLHAVLLHTVHLTAKQTTKKTQLRWKRIEVKKLHVTSLVFSHTKDTFFKQYCPCCCYIFQLLSQLSAFPGLAGMGMYGLPGTGLPATGTGLQGYSSFNAVNPTNSTDQQLQALNNYAALSAAG